ncbi:MAG: A/G-specific adenine glycosylase [Myxococcota bacterium]
MGRAEGRRRLHEWFVRVRRRLPWRQTDDPYRIWVSEIMLQQTRAETVIPYYQRFVDRFPDLKSLADAEPDEVRSFWSGLGYYRRAQLMLRCAKVIGERHGGRFPTDPTQLAELPGFGPYTVGAVASLAFGLPVAAVDGNVERVVSRLLALEGDIKGRARSRRIREEANSWVDGPSPGRTNEALMELGATVCIPRNPRCLVCPLHEDCEARRQGIQDSIPPPKTRKPAQLLEFDAVIFLEKTRIALVKGSANGLFPEMWCVPLERPNHDLSSNDFVARVEHRLTHRTLSLRVRYGSMNVPSGARMVELSDLHRVATPTVVPKILKVSLPKELLDIARWRDRVRRR